MLGTSFIFHACRRTTVGRRTGPQRPGAGGILHRCGGPNGSNSVRSHMGASSVAAARNASTNSRGTVEKSGAAARQDGGQ